MYIYLDQNEGQFPGQFRYQSVQLRVLLKPPMIDNTGDADPDLQQSFLDF